MTKEEFLEGMQEVLQRDEPIALNMRLEDIEHWDSLAIMSTAAFLSYHFSLRLNMNDFKNMCFVGDIAKVAGLDL